MPLTLMRQDITHLQVDAIVNAANERLRAGGGVCGAIFAAAGRAQLQAACDEIGHVDTGQAVATPGFALPVRHIIHTAGPVWYGGDRGERELLASSYRSSLRLAHSLGDTSIAFPLISSGIYGYPPAEALGVAVAEIRAFLDEQPDMEVILCLFDRHATTLTEGLFGQISRYVDDTYVEESPYLRREVWEDNGYPQSTMADATPSYGQPLSGGAPTMGAAPQAAPPLEKEKRHFLPHIPWPHRRDREEEQVSYSMPAPAAAPPTASEAYAVPALEDLLDHLDASFVDTLFAMIDERGLTDAQVYARANLSRQYFSKLRGGKVNPSKRVVLSLAIALNLSLADTRLLLERAGHALTHASKFDVIVEWFIMMGRYDIFEINQALFAFDQPLLGSS